MLTAVNVLSVLGGVALILFGVRFLRKGLDRVVGPRLPIWVGRLTGGVFRTAATGLVMGALAPSTSTHGLLTVSFVRQGLIGIRRAIVMIMGAYVGATIMVHIVAADLAHYVPIGLLVGIMLYQGTKSASTRGTGQVVMAICFVLLGVSFISEAAAPASHSADLQELAELASGYPWLAALLAAILTAMLQSSTAALSVVIALALADSSTVTSELVVSYVIGVNVGIAVIALIAGWGEISARRFSIGALLCRLVVATVLLVLLGRAMVWFEWLPGTLAQQIALSHTAFNAGALVLAMMISAPLQWLVIKAVRPIRENNGDAIVPKAIDKRWADDPNMAFAQTKHEIGLAVRVTSEMLRDAWSALESRDQMELWNIRKRDDTVDTLERFVKKFLTRQLTNELGPQEVKRRLLQLRFVGDLETIADVVDKRICDAGIRASQRGVRFSDSGWAELRELYESVCEMVDLAGAAFMEESPEMARRLLAMKDEVRDQELEFRERHYARLQDGLQEAFDTTGLHLELMSQLKHIAHVAAGVAYGVLQMGEED
jgi:phosphate:Na+ symporter